MSSPSGPGPHFLAMGVPTLHGIVVYGHSGGGDVVHTAAVDTPDSSDRRINRFVQTSDVIIQPQRPGGFDHRC